MQAGPQTSSNSATMRTCGPSWAAAGGRHEIQRPSNAVANLISISSSCYTPAPGESPLNSRLLSVILNRVEMSLHKGRLAIRITGCGPGSDIL